MNRVDKRLNSVSLTISHSQRRRKTWCMADLQRNGVKSFVNSVHCYGRQPVKTNSFDQIMPLQVLQTNRTLLFLAIFLIEVSYERAEMELSRNVIFSLKFRYRPPNDFLVSSLEIAFNHSCVKYASYELQTKEDDLSFPNMCHLLIIIVVKLW